MYTWKIILLRIILIFIGWCSDNKKWDKFMVCCVQNANLMIIGNMHK